MKKRILISAILTILISLSSVFAQDNNYNHWSLEGKFGLNRVFSPFTNGYSTNFIGLFHADLGTRYMMNNKFGMQLDLGYDQIKNSKGSPAFNTNYMRATMQGVINLGNVFEFNDWTKCVSLLAHAGVGYSMLQNKSDLVHFGHAVMGLAPQFKITERFSMNIDLSLTGTFSQPKSYDFNSNPGVDGFDGYILTGSVGFSIYLGKNDHHADWHHPANSLKKTVDSLKNAMIQQQEKINSLETRVAKVETDLIDSDSDGVADKFDLEPTSKANAKVDTKGRETKEVILGNQSLDSLKGLFFTVQLGVYSQEVPSEVMKNISPLDTKTMPDGKIRYFSGAYASQEEAAVKLAEAKKAGVTDAFITAYFRGSRITLVEAKTFIQELGPEIIQKR